ncbi:MAG: hypothetical protein BWY03_00553 [Parcubacteria group bacterium ADurb.Bin159]|jgi:hypothetical protein|nr:MAG: hypothetical protein BWY03_00553 [Parcubacteria group bacterium ADurb.Bin159]
MSKCKHGDEHEHEHGHEHEHECDRLIENIGAIIKKMTKWLKKTGMTDEAIEALLNGEEIETCPYCHTWNLVITIDKNQKETGKCFFCGGTL